MVARQQRMERGSVTMKGVAQGNSSVLMEQLYILII